MTASSVWLGDIFKSESSILGTKHGLDNCAEFSLPTGAFSYCCVIRDVGPHVAQSADKQCIVDEALDGLERYGGRCYGQDGGWG